MLKVSRLLVPLRGANIIRSAILPFLAKYLKGAKLKKAKKMTKKIGFSLY